MGPWGFRVANDAVKRDFEQLLSDLGDPEFLGRLETRELSDAEIMDDVSDLEIADYDWPILISDDPTSEDILDYDVWSDY